MPIMVPNTLSYIKAPGALQCFARPQNRVVDLIANRRGNRRGTSLS